MDLAVDLLATPFSRQTFTEKLELMRREERTRTLAVLSQQGKRFVRHFPASNCEWYPWLTACGKFYRWDCLLVATEWHGVWSCTGFASLGCLSKAATKHQRTAVHLKARVLLKTFGDILS